MAWCPCEYKTIFIAFVRNLHHNHRILWLYNLMNVCCSLFRFVFWAKKHWLWNRCRNFDSTAQSSKICVYVLHWLPLYIWVKKKIKTKTRRYDKRTFVSLIPWSLWNPCDSADCLIYLFVTNSKPFTIGLLNRLSGITVKQTDRSKMHNSAKSLADKPT